MKFSEVVRLLEEQGFRLVREKGSIRYYGKPGWDRLGRIDSHASKETEDPNYFGFYSPDLEGFTGVGHSVEDCIYKARWGMVEHLETLREQGLPIPPKNPNPRIVIQNEQKLAIA